MRLVLSVVFFAASLAALWFLGFGGVNQLIAGLTETPKDWSDIIWGSIRAWFALPITFMAGSMGIAVLTEY